LLRSESPTSWGFFYCPIVGNRQNVGLGMITIDLEEAAKIIEAHKNLPKPEFDFQIAIAGRQQSIVDSQQFSTVDSKQSTVIQSTVDSKPLTVDHKTDLLSQCRAEFNELKIEQGKVSNTIAATVAGGASLAELKDLYAQIESYRPDLIKLYQRYKHVQQYGTLPVEQVVNEVSVDIFKLKDSRKKLVDERCKLGIKIKRGHIKEQKVQDWQLRLDEVNAEYAMLDEKIKNLEGK